MVLIYITINLFLLLEFSSKPLKNLSFILVIFISFLYGLRGVNIGIDSKMYASFFSYNYSYDTMEPGFYILRMVFNLITHNTTLHFIALSLIINSTLFNAIKRISSHYNVVLAMLYSSFLSVNININILRQGVAIGLSILSISFFIKRCRIKAIITLLIAILFHYTALIFLPMFIVVNKPLNKYMFRLSMIAVLLFFNVNILSLLINILSSSNSYFQRVIWYFKWSNGDLWRVKHIYYFVLLFAAIIFVIYNKINTKNQQLSFLFLIGLGQIAIFKYEEMVADRFFYYFIPVLLILFIEVFYLHFKRLGKVNIFFISCFAITNLWFLKSYIIQYPNWFIPPFKVLL